MKKLLLISLILISIVFFANILNYKNMKAEEDTPEMVLYDEVEEYDENGKLVSRKENVLEEEQNNPGPTCRNDKCSASSRI